VLSLNRCWFPVLLAAQCLTGAQPADPLQASAVTVRFRSPQTPRPSTAEDPGAPGVDWLRLDHWCRDNGLEPPLPVSGAGGPAFEVTTGDRRLVVQTRSQHALHDGLEVRLGFAPVGWSGLVFVHLLDLEKNVVPLLLHPPFVPRGRGVIVLDPGHGGVSTGTCSVLDGSLEKTYTLDWAQRLAPLLTARGWAVHLTRSNDTEVSLLDRVAVAEAQQADLFLSLHFNASGNGNHQAGLETYCLTPAGMASHVVREFADDSALSFPNNAFDAQNLRLAVGLHRALLAVNGGADRGVRRARFMTVLQGQNRPAVLIEAGYLSNPQEAARIADPAHRQKLAEAIAGALE
jgi:N-acetylmuramoyl-L-alanine amidase